MRAAVVVALTLGTTVATAAQTLSPLPLMPGVLMPVTLKLANTKGEIIGTVTTTPGSGIAYYRDTAGELIASSRTDRDGKMTFYDPSGNVMRSPLTGR